MHILKTSTILRQYTQEDGTLVVPTQVGHSSPLPQSQPVPLEIPEEQLNRSLHQLLAQHSDPQWGFQIQGTHCVSYREPLVELLSMMAIPMGMLHIRIIHTHYHTPPPCSHNGPPRYNTHKSQRMVSGHSASAQHRHTPHAHRNGTASQFQAQTCTSIIPRTLPLPPPHMAGHLQDCW